MKHETAALIAARRSLRRYSKETERGKHSSEGAAWAADNLPALEQALTDAQNSLTARNAARFARLRALWRDLCPGGALPEETKLAEGLAAFSPDLSDCALLYAAAGAHFTCAAAEAAEKERGGDEAAGETVRDCVRSLLALREVDLDGLTRTACEAEGLLNDDPAGEYAHMSEATKSLYRRAVIRGAARAGVREADFARAALEQARAAETDRHIGFYLPLRRDRRRQAVVFLAAEALLAVFASVGAAWLSGSLWWTPLLWLPLRAALSPLCEGLRARLFPPAPPCSMDEERPVGPEEAVLLTVTGLLPPAGESEALYGHLSRLRAAEGEGCVRVMLLLDKRNAPTPDLPEDAADRAAVERVIRRLNRDFGGGFAAAVRPREWAPTEREYTGFERKRGALIALAAYLRDGDGSRFETLTGDVAGLTGTRYLMALDGDTELSFGALRRLVAVARHPLNRPVVDPETLTVTRGYGCIAPRGEVSLASAGSSFFTRLFTDGGTLAYAPAVSERNMDLFGCSVFTGKGLLDVEAFHTAVGDRFEEGRILSHDILEGAVLRTAFAGESEITESFPSRPDSWFARMHRWVRGDAQNLRYLFRPVAKGPEGSRLPLTARWQLLQNGLRAAAPAAALGCLLAAPFAGRSGAVLFAAALLCEGAEGLFAFLTALLHGGLRSLTGRYFSTEIARSLKGLLRAVLSAGMLPRKGLVCGDALVRAAARSLFTHRHLLRWTTAQQAEGPAGRPWLSGCLLPTACAGVLGWFGGPFGRLTALLILLATVFSLADGLPLKRRGRPLAERDRETVRSFAAAAWRYFEGAVTAEEHFLPPDNVQETPVMRTAHRTSPTNVGLYLVSAMAARDLGLIGTAELLDRLTATLKTVADLPKYRGCLYNWYDTRTQAPLAPAYVSAVDCGNFLCCLTALGEGLKELEDGRARALRGLIGTLRETADLSFLYDKKRALFRVGYDTQKGELSGSCYDLLMSEARMTSYYAVSSRQVPEKHARALGRTTVRAGGYLSAASWTGTLFEYFMPCLFLPAPEGSFVHESLRACLAAQKKRMGRLPWGISESCFYAVDHAADYRYKAHGLASLALKRLADDEPVVSPYSSFLALPFDFRGAMKNLSALAALHVQGPCGFYEAVDFTPSRTGGEDYCVVRCYMAHHVGMSIVSAANALLDDVFVKRFMGDDAMRAGRSLLNEKPPTAPSPRRKRAYREPPQPPERAERTREKSAEDPFAGAAAYGGEWLLAADRYGRNRSLYSSLEMYRYSDRCRGVTVCVRTGGKTAALNTVAATQGKLGKTAFTATRTVNGVRFTVGLLAHPSRPALLVPVRAANESGEAATAEITFYFEPLLREAFREDPHPAFTDLFLRPEYHPARRALTFTRTDGAAAALCAGFCSGADFAFETDRERILPRDLYREAPVFFAGGKPERTAVCPAAALTVTVPLLPGKSGEQVLALTCAPGTRAALERLERIRSGGLPKLSAGAANPFAAPLSAPFAAAFLQTVFFGGESPARRDARQALTADRSALWAAGISGDRPLLTAPEADRFAPGALRALTRLHKRLTEMGIANDLVLVTEEDGYGAGENTAFDPLLREEGLLGDKGRPGGVYVLRKSALSAETLSAVTAFSAVLCPEAGQGETSLPAPARVCALPVRPPEDGGREGFFPGGYAIGREPALPWCHTLSNRTFGTLVSDRSLGCTWAANARLNPLTPWSNDVSSDLSGEKLFIELGADRYDAVCGARATFTDAKAVYESDCGPLRLTVTAAVPERGGKKRILLEAENRSGEPVALTARYRALPQLSERSGDAAFVRCRITEEGVFCRNPLNGAFPGVMLLYGDPVEAYGVGGETGGAGVRPKAEVSAALTIPPGGRKLAVFGMCFAATEEAALRLKRAPFTEKRERYLTASTGDEAADQFARALLLHQVRDTRLLARCGFYQCSGGYGFRDQLQDILPLTRRDPQLCREILCKMAAAQFPEGDVLHWFHPLFRGGEKRLLGVRTRCSDDRLWLPYAAAKYLRDTGDRDLLRRELPFLTGQPLAPGEKSRYEAYRHGANRASLYDHCLLAFAPVRLGRHGLPLMEGGDWNDGFDALGEKGMGESVWLAMFLRRAALDFAPVCHAFRDADSRDRLLRLAENMAAACEENAWDGDRYLRAFADDGSPVGKAGAAACAVDLLPQAWAGLADLPDREKTGTALRTAYRELFDEERGTVKLFTPPFTQKGPRAGYINDYPAGVRENGGQYTHAAVWFLTALQKEGMTAEADKVLRALLPNEKYRSPDGEAVYKTESYALCGDVYAAPGQEGRGGWSLYTGAAGWLMQYLAP